MMAGSDPFEVGQVCYYCCEALALCRCSTAPTPAPVNYGHTINMPGYAHAAIDAEFQLRNPRINGATCLCPDAVLEATGTLAKWPQIHRCGTCNGARFDKAD